MEKESEPAWDRLWELPEPALELASDSPIWCAACKILLKLTRSLQQGYHKPFQELCANENPFLKTLWRHLLDNCIEHTNLCLLKKLSGNIS